MASTIVDRFNVAPEEGIKAPCRMATTANITLSGLQTIDTIVGAVDDRVLVKSQTDATENGIYLMRAEAWVRAPDWNDNTDVLNGVLVAVAEGAVNATNEFMVSFSGSFTIDTTAVTFINRTGLSTSEIDSRAVRYFDTLALLDAETDLSVGERVSLAGRFAAGDGGQNDYKIVEAGTGTHDGGIYIDLSGSGFQAFALFTGGRRNVKQFGVVGDLVTDDTPKLTKAFESLGSAGGTVEIPDGVKVLIDTNLSIPPNVSLVGPHEWVGSPDGNSSANYGNLGGALVINSSATITVQGGGSITGCLIYRKGMTFPATDDTAYAGTAITGAGDDVRIYRCSIFGFYLGYYSTNEQRPRLEDLNIDCKNGIYVDTCYDISYIKQVHCWPFATIAAAGTSSRFHRNGSAFRFTNVGDWLKLTDCFSYGYHRGYNLENVNSISLQSCGADGTSAFAGQLGYYIIGTCNDTRLISCQAAGQETGVYVNTSANTNTSISNTDLWGNTSHNVLIDGGDVNIDGGTSRDCEYGVTVTNAVSVANIDNVRFSTLSLGVIHPTVSTSSIFLGRNNYYDGVPAGNSIANASMTIQSIASAEPLNLPTNGDQFVITGTTTITTLNAGWEGREVYLKFSDALTMTDGASMNLAGNFVTTADDVLHLRYIGGIWVEISRSVN